MDHSLFAVIKLWLYHLHHTDRLPFLLRPYLAVSAGVGVLLYFVRIRHLPFFNQLLALAVASIFFPPVSHDYTLLHLYTPFVVLALGMVAEKKPSRRQVLESALLACFLVLFSSESYLIWHGIRFAGQVKAVVLVILFITALSSPLDLCLFPDRKAWRLRPFRA